MRDILIYLAFRIEWQCTITLVGIARASSTMQVNPVYSDQRFYHTTRCFWKTCIAILGCPYNVDKPVYIYIYIKKVVREMKEFLMKIPTIF